MKYLIIGPLISYIDTYSIFKPIRSHIIVIEVLGIASVLGSLAASKSSIIVNVGYFVAHVRTVIFLAFYSLWIDQPLVLSLDVRDISRVTRLISLYSVVLVFVRDVSIWETFGRSCFSFKEVVYIIFESGILADEFIQQFFILAKLTF